MRNKQIIIIAVFMIACVSIWIGAATPEWIQYYERVVGENSPYYTDVVNRPSKQIWTNFTSQHTPDGEHKSAIFPTPLPTATPIPESLASLTYTTQQKLMSSMALNNGSLGGGMISPGNVFTRVSSWQVFDSTTVHANSKGFRGGVFDGRYVYFVPNNSGVTSGQVTRYDTSGGFTDPAAWSVFDSTTVNANSKGFIGGVFDGRYVYFVPCNSAAPGQVTRYDTSGGFTDPAAWSVFDSTTVHANSKGFFGGVFDGRYVYFVPNGVAGVYHGQVTRYDTAGGFTDPAAWSVFDSTTVNANSKGFIGGIFDGRYVYFVPYYIGTYSGQVTRYDTSGGFTDPAAWSVFNSTAVHANSKGFYTAVFDGRYVYFVPNYSVASSGQVTRYDTAGGFTDLTAWSVFDSTTVNANSKGFRGGIFDGRYVYFVPNNSGVTSGQVTRYDTSGVFTDPAAWSVFDSTTVNANSKGFVGGVFDGRYLYFVPNNSGVTSGQVTRYDTGRYGDRPDSIPTPQPTATPKPDATPQPTATPFPTATPKPDATPQPTATPLLTGLQYGGTSASLNIVASPYTVTVNNGGCFGTLHVMNVSGTIYLPDKSVIDYYHCHTIRLVINQNSGAVTVSAGANTTIIYTGNTAASSIVTDATPSGYYIELVYTSSYDKWVVAAIRGIWTAS